MGHRREQPQFPKPYDFVPFTEQQDQQRPFGHQAFRLQDTLSGRLVVQIELQTLLHISSGSYALSEDLGLKAGFVIKDMYKVLRNGIAVPAIPGSTLKGGVRTLVEAVTNSCLIAVPGKLRRKLPRSQGRSCGGNQLCPACALFGAMGQLARVSFSDVLFVSGDSEIFRLPSLYRTRAEDSYQYVDANDRLKGRKFYLHGIPQRHREGGYAEALKAGSVLRGNIDFTNLTPAELGLLCFGLGLDNSFQLALGGGKPLAMGRVKISAQELQLQQTASFLEYETGNAVLAGNVLTTAVSDYITQAEPLIQDVQLEAVRRILDPNNQRPAPTGTY